MKKFFYALTGVVLAFGLIGCSATKVGPGSGNEETRESEEVSGSKEFQESREEAEIQEEAELQDEWENQGSMGGYSEGRMGDTMNTYFFDYTVNSAYLCDEFNGYLPAEGNRLLVAEVTVKNTFKETITMFDTDFQVQWNSDGADDYDVPITYYADPVSDEQLLAVYDLGVNNEETGLLVFEVPEGRKDFSISYLELFDDDSEGDVYFVFFTADEQ